MVFKYIKIALVALHLVYLYFMFIINDSVISKIPEVDSKVTYIWNKKARFVLLMDEFSSTDDCVKSVSYMKSLIYGGDLHSNAG